MAEKIRVLIVEDQAVVRAGLTAILEAESNIDIVGEAGDGLEAINKAIELKPDVILMDIFMPGLSGLEATVAIRQKHPDAKVLILTISDKDEDLFTAIKAGAKGYILKGADPEELVRAITHVAEGGVIISPVMAPRLLSEIGTEEKPMEPEASVLSPRETEILHLIAKGLTDKEIADRLFISLNTAKTHLKNILVKLQLKSRTQAAAYEARTRTMRENDAP